MHALLLPMTPAREQFGLGRGHRVSYNVGPRT